MNILRESIYFVVCMLFAVCDSIGEFLVNHKVKQHDDLVKELNHRQRIDELELQYFRTEKAIENMVKIWAEKGLSSDIVDILTARAKLELIHITNLIAAENCYYKA